VHQGVQIVWTRGTHYIGRRHISAPSGP
jgi:hypothetical protein